MTTTHKFSAGRLVEGDRILLKDLRVLTVERTRVERDSITVYYREISAKETGSLDLDIDRTITTICKSLGWCRIDQELDTLI